MADQAVANKGVAKGSASNGQGSASASVKRERRIYDYEMQPKDRVALRAVLAAKNVLSAAAVEIQEGKGCNVEFYNACIQIQKEAGFQLFGV